MNKQQPLGYYFFLLIVSALTLAACLRDKTENNRLSTSDINSIRAVTDEYVTGWLDDDTSAILNTLDEQAVLMPAGMKPIIGKENIKQFWWPNDGSRTKVTEYTMKVMEIDGNNDLAYTRGRAELTFTYEKDEEKTEQTNSTMSLTLYRRDPEKGWRILRRMWGPLRQ